MPQTEPSPPQSSSTPPAPTVRLPPRISAESLFMGGSSISPGPMTLVSSFFSENDPDYDCCSFTQLLSSDAPSPSSAPNAGHDFRFQQNRPAGLVVSQLPGMFTIPPGLSPASLLDSRGFIQSNSQVKMSSSISLPTLSESPPCVDIEVDVEVRHIQSPGSTPIEPMNNLDSSDDGRISTTIHLDTDSTHIPSSPNDGNFDGFDSTTAAAAAAAAVIIITVLVLLIVLVYEPRSHQRFGPTIPVGHHNCTINFSVSNDGKSDYLTVREAVEATPNYSPVKVCILIRSEVYDENVRIDYSKTNIVLMGEGIQKTIITSNSSALRTSTLWVFGGDFMAENLTISNTAESGVAVKNFGERSVFFRCNLEGKSHTLILKGLYQFYRDCRLSGRNYLVAGTSWAFFQRCEFKIETSFPEDKFVVFLGTDSQFTSKTRFIFHLCKFYRFGNGNSSRSSFLANAHWRFAHIVLIQSYLDTFRYLTNSSSTTNTLIYVFSNTGRGGGADMKSLPPYVFALNTGEAEINYSLKAFLCGNNWIPQDVDYDLDIGINN